MIRNLAALMLLLAVTLLSGCESMQSAMGGSGAGSSGGASALTGLLTQQLGVTENQANGGIGAMLKLAQEKLAKGDFDQVAKAVPGADKYLGTAKQLLGGKNVGDMAGLQSAFSKLGMSPDMIGKFSPLVTQFVGSTNPQAGQLLAGVLK